MGIHQEILRMLSTANSSGHVYPFELHGNTLVVRPRGDSVSFGIHQIRADMTEVRKLIANPRVKHLLVDLSTEKYFGSMVLGDVMEFGKIIKARGGRTGLCQASSDMLAVLNFTQMDQMWEFFPSTTAGLNAVATIPISQRVWKYRMGLSIAAAVCVLTAAFWFWPRIDPGTEDAKDLVTLWQEFDRERPLAQGEELHQLNQKARSKLQPMLDRVQQRSRWRRLSPLEQSVLFTVRPWLMSLDFPSNEATEHLIVARHNIAQMRQFLRLSPAMDATVPVEYVSPEASNLIHAAAVSENVEAQTPPSEPQAVD